MRTLLVGTGVALAAVIVALGTYLGQVEPRSSAPAAPTNAAIADGLATADRPGEPDRADRVEAGDDRDDSTDDDWDDWDDSTDDDWDD
jgi:hypothetical protein